MTAIGDVARRDAHSTFSDPEFYSALGAATLPGIDAIARELAQSRAARGERRAEVIDDPSPPMCDAPIE